jgi:phosphoribosylformylglycinamidine cyclo-ligase
LLKNFHQPSSRAVGQGHVSKDKIHGIAHITGGGFVDNIPRVLPNNCDAQIRLSAWPVPPIFALLKSAGGVPDRELYQVFNMGIGMVLMVAPEASAPIMAAVQKQGIDCWLIGEISRGTGKTRLLK